MVLDRETVISAVDFLRMLERVLQFTPVKKELLVNLKGIGVSMKLPALDGRVQDMSALVDAFMAAMETGSGCIQIFDFDDAFEG